MKTNNNENFETYIQPKTYSYVSEPNYATLFNNTSKERRINRIARGARVDVTGSTTVNNNQWNYVTWGFNSGVILSSELSTTNPTGSTHPQNVSQAFGFFTLEKGSKSYYVKNLQLALNHLGYNTGSPDGIFGTATENAVKSFQNAQHGGLTVDGKVGASTRPVLWVQAEGYLKMNGVMFI